MNNWSTRLFNQQLTAWPLLSFTHVTAHHACMSLMHTTAPPLCTCGGVMYACISPGRSLIPSTKLLTLLTGCHTPPVRLQPVLHSSPVHLPSANYPVREHRTDLLRLSSGHTPYSAYIVSRHAAIAHPLSNPQSQTSILAKSKNHST